MGKPHVLAVPCPAQGHVIPMMELSHCLANNGIRVTFVNTEFNHERVVQALSTHTAGQIHELIDLVSIPDGLESSDDRMDLGKLAESICRVMPGELTLLVEKMINRTEQSDEITCVVADVYMGFAMEVAKKLGIKRAAFLPASVAMLALTSGGEKLIDDGIVDRNGTPLKNQVIHLSPSMPEMSTKNLPWFYPDLTAQKLMFQSIMENNKSAKLAQRLICNTSPVLEPGAIAFLPDCLPIGPLLASSRLGNSSGHFCPEDSTSLEWLDRHPPNSVIYVAFGSLTVLDQMQFQELALALEHTNKPFLLVLRQDIVAQEIDNGFKEQVRDRGKIVGWAPQQKVLSHPAIACFLSHCGWNSTIEGVSNGVPFLCWPYFADQFINETYICDHWGVGLGLEKDESGIIRREEIESKVERLLSDCSYRTRSLELRAKIMDSVGEGGCTQKNFNEFVEWVKES